jgi:2-polyprenyl-6-methoxyphenol hydroxylase-like FAD-dependent oxidoreductase
MSPTELSINVPTPVTAAYVSSRALVVGASMAGLSAAAQLSSIGYTTTVIEHSPHLRLTGSPIDVRGKALHVAERMGILDTIRANRVSSHERTVFTTFVDSAGNAVAQLPLEMANDSEDDIEISRDALVDILHGAIDSSVDFIYRDSPVSLTEIENGVEVGFKSGRKGKFDIVVGADGIHSSVRRLVMGPESEFRRHLGVYYAIIDLPPGARGISNESRTFNIPGRMVGINDYGDRSYGVFAFRAPEIDYDYRSQSSQKQLLMNAFSEVKGWHVPYLLETMQSATDLYFDSVSQVHMAGWSQGRVVLLGDAAHAASLFSGRGTSLAMMGAALLAEELTAAGQDHVRAFAGYEARLRPSVLRAQSGVIEARNFMVPETQDEISARNRQFTGGERLKTPASTGITASTSFTEAT